jgi:hydroxypyruvate reductase/glycerate 2-kinase
MILREHARAVWQSAVDSVAPARLIRRALRVRGRTLQVGTLKLPLDEIDSIAVVGAGKAGSAMARGVEEALGDRSCQAKRLHGIVNVPDRSVVPLRYIRLHGARAAPDNKPTEAGVAGSCRIREIVESAGPRDLVLCLLSGGGSALMPAPVEGVSLADKQAITGLLHACGATINEMNAVRKHLSQLKGGGLARLFRGGWLVSLIISDVIGDPLDVIASGPTAADRSSFADALAVLEKHRLLERTPASVLQYLRAGAAGQRPGTLKRLPRNVVNLIIGNNATALGAAERTARRLGYRVVHLSSFIEGEAREVGIVLGGIARGVRDQHRPIAPPACIVGGGETTVTLEPGYGKGGRNQELVLAALQHLRTAGMHDMVLLSGGTDGEDGPTDAAGAIADAEVVRSAARHGLDAADYLRRHDPYPFFDAAGGLIRTGLTDTNVTDVQVMLVGPPPLRE